MGKYADWAADYWTALLLCAQSHIYEAPRFVGPGRERPSSVFVDLVVICLDTVDAEWSRIAQYMDEYLSDDSTFMQPDLHDTLLIDDGSFSRSRRYFWIISTLSDFEDKLQITIDQWPVYRKNWTTSWESGHPENWNEEVCKKLEMIEDKIGIFRDRVAHFKALRSRAIALRDGLFNASSVMESRSANHLGRKLNPAKWYEFVVADPIFRECQTIDIGVDISSATSIHHISILHQRGSFQSQDSARSSMFGRRDHVHDSLPSQPYHQLVQTILSHGLHYSSQQDVEEP